MFGQTFYHKTLRKNVVLFGTLFNDIYINRETTDGRAIETLKVPISYGPKEKTLARVNQDPGLDRPFQITLPRMSFEMTGMSYDNQRKLNTINKGYAKQDYTGNKVDKLKYLYNPVPYNINFSLYVMVRNAEDGTKILEQILPYFAPEWTVTVNLIKEMDGLLDIPTIIQNINVTDTYEGSVEERRTIVWQIDFIMKTYLFGPIKRQGVIKVANTTLTDFTLLTDLSAINLQNTSPSVVINTRPGLTIDGKPTTDIDETIPYSEIEADDDWDYIIRKTDLYER